MKEAIKIRPAKEDELPTLLEFEQGIINAERPYDSTLAEDPISYYDLIHLINSEDAEVLVAEVDQLIVGAGYARIQKAKPYLDHKLFAYLGFMFVKEEHRGKGINKLIIKGLMDWTRAKGINEMRLEVYDGNEAAVKAYEKAGFSKNLVEMRIRLDD